MAKGNFDFTHGMIISSYKAYLNLIPEVLGRMIPDVFRRHGTEFFLFNSPSTVTLSQMSENGLVIYSKGRGPHHQGPVGSTALIDNSRDIYVLTTRSMQILSVELVETSFVRIVKAENPFYTK